VALTPNDGDQADPLAASKQVVEQAMQEAANEAILLHQRLGLPMVEWQNDKIVLVPPDQLTSPDDSAPQ
jgi:hypothetical protein